MASDVYITEIAGFLPNHPVHNDDMEQVLGKVGGIPSRARRVILRNNGIQTRYYAIDPATGQLTHTNAQLTAEAIRALQKRSGFDLAQLDCLSCGTSSPDQIKPPHGSMVHGELGSPPCEVVSTAGVCTSGISALKFAYLSVASGQTRLAVSTGSELASSFMRASHFTAEIESQITALEREPELAFEKDFLRWMLSDGAAAALIQGQARKDRPSLRIDWIDGMSFAGEMLSCMYSGAIRRDDGSLQGWRATDNPADAVRDGYFSVKQDARLLNETILPISINRALLPIAARRKLKPGDISWFLPHYSSEYFRPRLHESMAAAGFAIPQERWFSNLTTKGNVGSASIYLMLEELLDDGRLKAGDRLLCYIPESSRFNIYYMHLTVV